MSTDTLWWTTLAIGLLIAVAVIALLHLLLEAVRRVDENVSGVWTMARQLAANTATTWMLGQTPHIAAEIKEEALRHDALLSKGDA